MNLADTLFLFGRLFSPLYSGAMLLRAHLYRAGIFNVAQMPVPVISIGNLTMGGSGKTPIVGYVCSVLSSHGLRPAIISRGYGGSASKNVNIVSDGKDIHLNASEAGDEPYMLARTLPGVVVLTGKKRAEPCRYAIDAFQCNVLVLDDGFQHLAVHRDLDIVLFNVTSRISRYHVVPGGELREPFSAIARADAILFTGASDTANRQEEYLREHLAAACSLVPFFRSRTLVNGVFALDSSQPDVAGRRYYAFSGIANPTRFFKSLDNQGINIAGSTVLRDHARYSADLINNINGAAKEAGADALITTEKDIVKLLEISSELPIHYLAIEARPERGFAHFILTHPSISALLN